LPFLGICSRHPPLEIAVSGNKVLHTTGNFPRCTSVHKLHIAFNLPYVYYYIRKLYMPKLEVYEKS
jgi:hypothetical protein